MPLGCLIFIRFFKDLDDLTYFDIFSTMGEDKKKIRQSPGAGGPESHWYRAGMRLDVSFPYSIHILVYIYYMYTYTLWCIYNMHVVVYIHILTYIYIHTHVVIYIYNLYIISSPPAPRRPQDMLFVLVFAV